MSGWRAGAYQTPILQRAIRHRRSDLPALTRSSITSEVRIATSKASPLSIRFFTDDESHHSRGRPMRARLRTKFIDHGFHAVRSQHVKRRVGRSGAKGRKQQHPDYGEEAFLHGNILQQIR
jgi:hypothetical protein